MALRWMGDHRWPTIIGTKSSTGSLIGRVYSGKGQGPPSRRMPGPMSGWRPPLCKGGRVYSQGRWFHCKALGKDLEERHHQVMGEACGVDARACASPRLNKIPEVSTTKKVSDKPSSEPGYKVVDVWYIFQAKLEDKLPYRMAYENINEWGDIEGEPHPVLAYAASADPNTMYYHEAMRKPDSTEFIKAMGKEVQSHQENEVWELVPRSSAVPTGTKNLPAVWAMKRKRRIPTREL